MASTGRPAPFRWRSILAVAAIAAVVYIFLGTPGFEKVFLAGSRKIETPKARAKIESLVYPEKDLECASHGYEAHIFSTRPLVIYVDGFLSDEDAEHLVKISKDKWQVSTVFNGGVETTDDSVRKSEKALIERDHIVQCIESRALAFQGWPESTFIERLWTQRYNVSGHYAHHYDWASASKEARRASTFMVYVSAECEGGGTEFPRLKGRRDGRWCEFLDCERAIDEGVVFRARKGAAVFWMNFDEDGRGYKETIHAGLPVTEGTKVGLNIWSWYQAGHEAG